MKNKSYLFAILVIAICAIAIPTFCGCASKPSCESDCDLIFIKVNNVMAEWQNKDYNFTYEGNNTLNVVVPYTKILSITDICVSPNAEFKLYTDEKRKQEIADINAIETDKSYSDKADFYRYYIRVTQKGRKYLDYELLVQVIAPKVISNGATSVDIPSNNSGGHIWISNDIKKIIIGSKNYNVIRTYSDLHAIAQMNENYILANDIECSGNGSFVIQTTNQIAFDGELNGNNYNIDLKCKILIQTAGKNSLIQNLIFVGDRHGENLISNVALGLINNCVNKVNIQIKNNDGRDSFLFSDAPYETYEDLKTSKVTKCINYGTIESAHSFCGFSRGLYFDYCYNVGDIMSQYNAFVFGKEVYKISNCTNVGSVASEKVAMCKNLKTLDGHRSFLENMKNYGKISFDYLMSTGDTENPNSYVFLYSATLNDRSKNCINLGQIDRRSEKYDCVLSNYYI